KERKPDRHGAPRDAQKSPAHSDGGHRNAQRECDAEQGEHDETDPPSADQSTDREEDDREDRQADEHERADSQSQPRRTDERLTRAAGKTRKEEHDEDAEDEKTDKALQPFHDQCRRARKERRAAVVGSLPFDRPLHRRSIRDLRLVLARVFERAADAAAIGDLKTVDRSRDVATDARVDLHVAATRLEITANLTADRRIAGADDRVTPNSPVAHDRQLVASDNEVVRDLSIDHDRVARRAHAAADLPADRHAVSRGDHVSGHVAIDAYVAAPRDQVAMDCPVDRDVRPELAEVVVDRVSGCDRDVLSTADITIAT